MTSLTCFALFSFLSVESLSSKSSVFPLCNLSADVESNHATKSYEPCAYRLATDTRCVDNAATTLLPTNLSNAPRTHPSLVLRRCNSLVEWVGFEPTTYGVTAPQLYQLSHHPICRGSIDFPRHRVHLLVIGLKRDARNPMCFSTCL